MCRIIKRCIDSTELRKTPSTYPTGASVVTATGPDKQPRGMTINSLVSISLDPPLLGWCLDLKAASFADFAQCRFFSLSVLNVRQAALAKRFATRGIDKFAGLDCRRGPEGGEDAPLLISDACAWITCKLVTAKALEACGGWGFMRGNGIENLLRDVMASHFHPLQEKRQHLFTGSLAMGKDPPLTGVLKPVPTTSFSSWRPEGRSCPQSVAKNKRAGIIAWPDQ